MIGMGKGKRKRLLKDRFFLNIFSIRSMNATSPVNDVVRKP